MLETNFDYFALYKSRKLRTINLRQLFLAISILISAAIFGTSHLSAQSLDRKPGDVASVLFRSGGKELISGGGSNLRDWNTIQIWEIETGKRLAAFGDHHVSSMALSPDGKILATGSYDRTVCLWDIESEKKIATLRGHRSSVLAVAFSPDGNLLASGSHDTSVVVWSTNTKKPVTVIDRPAFPVLSVAFSPDGTTFAAGDDSIHLWPIETSKDELTIGNHVLLNGYYGSKANSIKFAPDNKTFAAGFEGGAVKIWEHRSRKEITTLDADSVFSLAYSSDSKLLAYGGLSQIAVWQLPIRKNARPEPKQKIKTRSLRGIVFSPDGKMIGGGGLEGRNHTEPTIQIWDTESGKAKFTTSK